MARFYRQHSNARWLPPSAVYSFVADVASALFLAVVWLKDKRAFTIPDWHERAMLVL